MRIPFAVFVALVVVFPQLPASASDLKWWATSAPYKATNGQITLPNASGTSRTLQTNPTGANVSTRTANTQAPTVVVQATASMPIKAVGDTCTAVTSGTSPNQTADENHAITADRTSLLTCQSGAWAKPSGGGTVAYSQWGMVYGGKCTVNSYSSPSTYFRFCFVAATNTITGYQYLANGTLIGTSSPYFDCNNVVATFGVSQGYCSQVGVSFFGTTDAAFPTTAGILLSRPNGANPITFAWN